MVVGDIKNKIKKVGLLLQTNLTFILTFVSFSEMCSYVVELPISKPWRPKVKIANTTMANDLRILKDQNQRGREKNAEKKSS